MNKIIINGVSTDKRVNTICDAQGNEYGVKEVIVNEQKEIWIRVEEE